MLAEVDHLQRRVDDVEQAVDPAVSAYRAQVRSTPHGRRIAIEIARPLEILGADGDVIQLRERHGGLPAQYDFGNPSTRSAMWQSMRCGLTGAMRAICASRR